jgi:hypothetical protein
MFFVFHLFPPFYAVVNLKVLHGELGDVIKIVLLLNNVLFFPCKSEMLLVLSCDLDSGAWSFPCS